jgi:hypothetical protein
MFPSSILRPRIASAAALTLVACASAPRSPELIQYGEMRAVMRDGHDEARVRLVDLGPVAAEGDGERAGLIAVGALAGLAGEVTADGATWWISMADEERVHVEREAADHAATLLTAARVEAWDEVVASDPLDEAALGALVRAHLESVGADVALPRALRIDGAVISLDLHVVRGDCPHAADAAVPAYRWHAPAGTKIVLVGFHAPGAEGVLTHHGTGFHLHAITPGDGARGTGPIAGHVDGFELAPGARVQIARGG